MTSNLGFSLAKQLFVVDADFQCEASPISCVLSALNSEIRSLVLKRTLNVRIWTNNKFSQTTLCFSFFSSGNQPFWYDLLRTKAVLPPNSALRVHGLRFKIYQIILLNFLKFGKILQMLMLQHLQTVCRIFTKIADFSNRFFAKFLRLQRCKKMQIL